MWEGVRCARRACFYEAGRKSGLLACSLRGGRGSERSAQFSYNTAWRGGISLGVGKGRFLRREIWWGDTVRFSLAALPAQAAFSLYEDNVVHRREWQSSRCTRASAHLWVHRIPQGRDWHSPPHPYLPSTVRPASCCCARFMVAYITQHSIQAQRPHGRELTYIAGVSC